jgi:hypothetical protein
MLSLLKKLFVFSGDSMEEDSNDRMGSESLIRTEPFLLETTFMYSS